MGIIYEEKEEKSSLGGYPVRETFFKEGEVLHFDKRLGKWIAKSIDSVDITGLAETYESISQNLAGYPYTITYNGDDIDYITYDLGGGESIVKTLNYTGDKLTSLVLSGDTPSGIDSTKTLNYTVDDLTSVTYS